MKFLKYFFPVITPKNPSPKNSPKINSLLGSKPTDKYLTPSFDYNGRIQTKPGWTRVVGEKDVTNRTLMAKVGNVSDAMKQPVDPVR